MPTPHSYTATDGTVTWRVRVRNGETNTSETFTSKAAALKFCRDVAAVGVDSAVRQREAEGRQAMTLDELAEQWLTWKTADPDVRSDRTVADYRRDYDNWIRPTLGGRYAEAVTEADVQRWVDAMVAGKLGKKLEPKSVGDRHMILHGIYAYGAAPSRSLVPNNPAVGTRLPKRRKKPPKGLRPAEWQALYPALRLIDTDAADLCLFMLSTTWRFSEATALTAYSVEDDGTTMHVTMGQVVRRNAAGQHVIVEDAKSDAGLRRAKLDAKAAEMVRGRLDKVKGDGLVFTTRTGRQWHHGNFLNRIWKPAVAAANLSRQPTPHWLRHTSVGWLIMSGKVSLPEIQRRVGHENIATTVDVYGRMVEDVSDLALDAFAEIRDGKRQPPQIT